MCGIVGIFDARSAPELNTLERMRDAMIHRGPDAGGSFAEGGYALGHRRLSIIDLSTAANQPFVSRCGNYVMVYNGEVYNYQELIKRWNLEMITSSDTEVILEGFIKYGESFVHELNGMFAFVILNKKEGSLFICRDRLGVKPLYYFWDGTLFAFASELKALLQHEYIRKSISLNKPAVSSYLHLGYIQQPLSIYKGIEKFPSGAYATFDCKTVKISNYWEAEKFVKAEPFGDYEEAKDRLRHLLTDSVRLRMISDVPFGTFLSGGIDSSLVSALAQKNSAQKIKTFSIGFREGKFNEAEYARKVAEYLGTEHYEFTVSEREAQDHLMEVMANFDEPFADPSALPTFMVSRLAREYVTVILTGDGGDEFFMGYGMYQWARRLENPWVKMGKPLIRTALGASPKLQHKRGAKYFESIESSQKLSHIFSTEQYFFSIRQLRKICRPEFYSIPELKQRFLTERKLSAAEEQALFDVYYYLKDDLLTKVDRSSMLTSLEAREPLLDYRVAEFALNLPEHFKYREGIMKYIFKELLYELVPASYFDRPKWGFTIPLRLWLKNELRELMESYVNKKVIDDAGIMEWKEVEKIKQRYLKGYEFEFNKLWSVMVLHHWYKNSLCR